MSYRKKYLLCFIYVLFVTSIVGSLHERSLEVSIFQSQIDSYRHILHTFFSQDWATIALSNKASSSVAKETAKFASQDTLCVKFFFERKEVGSFGSCIELYDLNNFNLGWSSHEAKLVLNEDYLDNIDIITVIDNPLHYTIEDGLVKSGLKTRHLFRGAKSIFISILIFHLLFAIYYIIEKIKAQREQSRDRLHDHGENATDFSLLADELETHADSPNAIRKIAYEKRCVGELKKALLCTEGKEEKEHRLSSLLEDFTIGFFEVRDKTIFEFEQCNQNIFVRVDKGILYRVLSNLFENAFNAVVGCGKFTLTILEGTREVELVVSNAGKIANPSKVFNRGVSNRGSTGRGLAIVDEALSGGTYLTYSDNCVSFSFKLSKAMEATCPVFYS